jgi:hypothetical protein
MLSLIKLLLRQSGRLTPFDNGRNLDTTLNSYKLFYSKTYTEVPYAGALSITLTPL